MERAAPAIYLTWLCGRICRSDRIVLDAPVRGVVVLAPEDAEGAVLWGEAGFSCSAFYAAGTWRAAAPAFACRSVPRGRGLVAVSVMAEAA